MARNAPHSETETSKGPLAAVEVVGFWILVLIAFLLPVLFLPANQEGGFQTYRSELIAVKDLALQMLSALVLVLGAIMVLGSAAKRYIGPALLPVSLLGGFLLWGLLSTAFSPSPVYSFQSSLSHFLACGAALTAPMFLYKWERVRWLLLAIVAGGVFVAFFGVIGGLGFRGFNTFVYGMDPRTASENPELRALIHGMVQGGMSRAASMSTLTNPEYAGSLMAPIAALCAVVLLDWTPLLRQKLAVRIAGLVVIGLLLLELVLSGSRQPWIALGLAAMLRLSMVLGIRARWMAVLFALLLVGGLLFGITLGGVIFLVGFGVLASGSFLNGRTRTAFRESPQFNRTILLGIPAAMIVLLVAFSVPGPWNPFGLRVGQRFASLASGDDQSLRERLVMYMLAGEMSLENPVLGVGPGLYGHNYTLSLADLAEEDESGLMSLVRLRAGNAIASHSHNDYMQFAAERGIPALLLFLGAMLAIARGLIAQAAWDRWRGVTALAVLVTLMTFCAVMLTSFPLHTPGRAGVFWMTVAGALGMLADKSSPASEGQDAIAAEAVA